MHLIIAAGLVLALLFGPAVWVRRVMARHSKPANRYPGTGGELARHLLDRLGLHGVKVEATEQGDHYDPEAKAVRLTQDKLNGRSLTAMTVAAHEVGHAVQDYDGYAAFHWRGRLVRASTVAEKVGGGMLVALPVVILITRVPATGLLFLAAGLLSLGAATIVHLVTLPVELDASFGRALPLLDKGRYLKPEDRPAARRILTAAAMTYVAASLTSLLNIWRWMRLARR